MREEEDCNIPTGQNTETFEATDRVEMPMIQKVAKLKVDRIYREKAEEEEKEIAREMSETHFMILTRKSHKQVVT